MTIKLKFYYPIKLHYSQTRAVSELFEPSFYYPIKLHYSQTEIRREENLNHFTTL